MRKLWMVGALLAGCGGTLEIGTANPDDFWYSQDDVKAAKPDGKQLGMLGASTDERQQRNRFQYHSPGPVMSGGARVYLIWYGNWNGFSGAQAIVTDLVQNLSGSAYYRINTRYTDSGGGQVSDAVQYGGSSADASYSRGAILADADLAAIVSDSISTGALPNDPSGVYFVIGSPTVSTAELCTSYCALHNFTQVGSNRIAFAFIGNPSRCPAKCQPQAQGPNGDPTGDAMASLVAAELSNAVTDPTLASWYDRRGFEVADKCAWSYGLGYTAANGAVANVRLGARDYLLQQLWVYSPAGGPSGGACGLSL